MENSSHQYPIPVQDLPEAIRGECQESRVQGARIIRENRRGDRLYGIHMENNWETQVLVVASGNRFFWESCSGFDRALARAEDVEG